MMQEKSVFISSCTRRELARRRSHRAMMRAQLLMAACLIPLAVGAFFAAHGGL
jgi:hypothetical protein